MLLLIIFLQILKKLVRCMQMLPVLLKCSIAVVADAVHADAAFTVALASAFNAF